ncbi:hypothetical protein RSSM_02752 [Rhodopirellula sallentina SM41]|uniref:Uncharacterized protein n=1 Tax=Rhodopirellula sallentina SM41 TaxID=1263870 RepID=M5UD79_9BACT|nr:hypothetical protein RSSM_02752 [Rhodopirellula sallentina SM41]
MTPATDIEDAMRSLIHERRNFSANHRPVPGVGTGQKHFRISSADFPFPHAFRILTRWQKLQAKPIRPQSSFPKRRPQDPLPPIRDPTKRR